MTRLARMLAPTVVVLLMMPTGAGAAPAPQIEDPCGDSSVNVRVDGQDQVPQDPYSVHWDVRQGSFQTVWSNDEEPVVLGIDVRLQLCDLVETPATPQQSYSIAWTLLPECGEALRYSAADHDDPEGFGTPIAEYRRTCAVPLGGTPEAFVEPLTIGDEVVVEGETLVFRLRYDKVGDEVDLAIGPDRLLRTPTAATSGAVIAAGQSSLFVNQTGVAAAPISDTTQGGTDFRVGSDRPSKN